MTEGVVAGNPDILHRFGESVLKFDTRFVILSALALFLGVYYAKMRKKSVMPQTESVRLALALGQVYTALVVFSVFVLTKPPAVELMSEFQRQTSGLIVMVFLIVGVFQEIKKFWES